MAFEVRSLKSPIGGGRNAPTNCFATEFVAFGAEGNCCHVAWRTPHVSIWASCALSLHGKIASLNAGPAEWGRTRPLRAGSALPAFDFEYIDAKIQDHVKA